MEEMAKLVAGIRKIRRILGVKPCDKQPDNPDFGVVGQAIENLVYREPGAWEQVLEDPSVLSRVIKVVPEYLAQLESASL